MPYSDVRQLGVERNQQVEALLLADLSDQYPVGAHPEGLLDQPAQPDLAGAFEVGLAGLHGHHIGQRDAQFEDLFTGNHPLTSRDRRGEAVEQRCLPGLGTAGHDEVEPARHRRVQEASGRRGERAERDQLVQ